MMTQQETLRKNGERTILVGVITGRIGNEYTSPATIAELEELAKSAGAEVVGVLTQNRPAPEKGTYLGEGKLEELAQMCRALEAELVIFDDELTGSQQRNIEQVVGVRVIDRSTLILDIFAARAVSREGKLQVELAQLQYRLPRLIGSGTELSRLGAGIGTRGPGESKLESDRRHIRHRIHFLKEELKEVAARRQLLRQRRKKENRETVVLVGYTNAGKSTIMNYLTDAGILAEDKLFATLDPTARALLLPDEREVILIDTVGFIRKLPHHLVEAFHSTLEEAANADLILNVVDIGDAEYKTQLEISQELLRELGCGDKPQMIVYNQCDKLEHMPQNSGNQVYISAKNGAGMQQLLETATAFLPCKYHRMQLLLPYEKSGLAAAAREDGKVISEEYVAEGVSLVADIDQKAAYKYEPFQI